MEMVDLEVYRSVLKDIEEVLGQGASLPLPEVAQIQKAEESLVQTIPKEGHGLQKISHHLSSDIVPGLNGQSLSPTYYGFVTGGVTPASRIAEAWVSLYDQNVQVHLPKETVATAIEDRALCLLIELLRFEPSEWPGRTLTTGATASNVLGMACGRNFVLGEHLRQSGRKLDDSDSFLFACRKACIDDFQLLANMPHSSIAKAASIVGFGGSCLKDVSGAGHPLRFDLEKLEQQLSRPNRASIVVITCGEINTGDYSTNSTGDMRTIRSLCDKYGAWLHVDGGKFSNSTASHRSSVQNPYQYYTISIFMRIHD